MRIAVVSTLLLAFTPLPGPGQNSAVYTPPGGLRNQAQSHMCPLTMHVRQRGLGSLIATDDQGRRKEQLSARLKLEIADDHPEGTAHRMVSAAVTVHGWTSNARAVPAGWTFGSDGSPVRRMTVPLKGSSVNEAAGDLVLPGLSAARMVQLDSITYDDGQVWTLASCQAEPDPFMPVEDSK